MISYSAYINLFKFTVLMFSHIESVNGVRYINLSNDYIIEKYNKLILTDYKIINCEQVELNLIEYHYKWGISEQLVNTVFAYIFNIKNVTVEHIIEICDKYLCELKTINTNYVQIHKSYDKAISLHESQNIKKILKLKRIETLKELIWK